MGSRTAPFNAVKVFSATMLADRDRLGEKVTAWLTDHKDITLTEIVVTQSSDEQYHCIAITVFYCAAALAPGMAGSSGASAAPAQ